MRLVKNHPIIYAFWELILKEMRFQRTLFVYAINRIPRSGFYFGFQMLLYIIMPNIVKKNRSLCSPDIIYSISHALQFLQYLIYLYGMRKV